MTKTPTWLISTEAAERARVTVHTIRDAFERGDLTGCKVAGRLLFKPEWIDAWIESRTVAATSTKARARRKSA